MHALAIGVRCLIGVVFLVSSVGKVLGRRRFGDFVAAIRRVPAVPTQRATAVAAVVVAAEFAVWILLVIPTPLTAAVGCALAAVLLAVFVIGIASALGHSVAVPCRCFGASTAVLGLPHLIRNAILALLAAAGAVSALWAASASTGTAPGVETVVAALAGALLGGLVVVLDDVLELFLPAVPKPFQHR
ncbi:MauE/DoxX family redox-associated membrane protein [Streptomyces macrosporus]|uniref:Methylamine utilisation protein MauE domain-containing protein n=1 Tax=Streptomyces macrosporus TaxID=44032 RepID=A0ABP5XL76_9ACTN